MIEGAHTTASEGPSSPQTMIGFVGGPDAGRASSTGLVTLLYNYDEFYDVLGPLFSS
jgi:hypothetical protein